MNAIPTTGEIINRVRTGESEAFLWIVRAHSLSLRSYLASQLYAQDDADDLAQEVFLVAYRDLDRFQPDEDFGAWLRGIARNKLRVFFRAQARRNAALARFRQQVSSAIENDLENLVSDETEQSIEALLRCVAKLPGRLRKVVRAGLDGTKAARLAEELSATVTAVYNLHYRANGLLRDCVKKEMANG